MGGGEKRGGERGKQKESKQASVHGIRKAELGNGRASMGTVLRESI